MTRRLIQKVSVVLLTCGLALDVGAAEPRMTCGTAAELDTILRSRGQSLVWTAATRPGDQWRVMMIYADPSPSPHWSLVAVFKSKFGCIVSQGRWSRSLLPYRNGIPVERFAPRLNEKGIVQ